MSEYKNKTVLVIDNGLFVELAVTLSKSFGKVFYYMPWESAFPKSNQLLVGKYVPGITRIDDFWSILEEIDLFVFPDVYMGSLQLHLQKMGKRVWGGRMGEELELDRNGAKKHMRDLGIDIGDYEAIIGLDALREFLQKNPRQFVKVSKTRGDFETFFAQDYKLIEPKLDELEHALGAKKRIMEFIVEAEIDAVAEVGYDGFTIDGRFPVNAMYGVEVKDKCLLLRTSIYDKLPEPVRAVNSKLASTLKGYQYRGFFSTEIRVTEDHHAYVIDPCARAGSPPSELYQIIVENWADIVWHGAAGQLVEPKFKGKWGAELLILSTWADKNWQAVKFPPSIREHVKLRNLTIIDGKYYVVPQAVGLPEIGAVVAYADTPDGAIAEVTKLAEKVEGYYIETVPESLQEAKEQMETLADL